MAGRPREPAANSPAVALPRTPVRNESGAETSATARVARSRDRGTTRRVDRTVWLNRRVRRPGSDGPGRGLELEGGAFGLGAGALASERGRTSGGTAVTDG